GRAGQTQAGEIAAKVRRQGSETGKGRAGQQVCANQRVNSRTVGASERRFVGESHVPRTCAPVMTDADIARLRTEFQQELARLSSDSDLQALRDKYLGRKNG